MQAYTRLLVALSLAYAVVPVVGPVRAQEDDECLMCHSEVTLTGTRNGRTVSVFVDQKKYGASVHASISCVGCHANLVGTELPHASPVLPVDCGTCHATEQEQHNESLHGAAIVRGDPLAPRCANCHGYHDILPVKNQRSAVAPMRVPYVCGSCHKEGTTVQRQRTIHQSMILENYSESIHGEGLLKKGLAVSATCASCHTAHLILPHTDPRSSIARRNIARTCTQCHVEIEAVHIKLIRGELWEKEAHVLPACVDCHQPHKARKVFYDRGMADNDCLTCHAKPDIRSTSDDRSLTVRLSDLQGSRHARTACSQCHTEVSPSRRRACETITKKVDCSGCHAEIGQLHQSSRHGTLEIRGDANAPSCKECHGNHRVLGKDDPVSATFPTNIPTLCARCHRKGSAAAVRIMDREPAPVEQYTESIHGKGLLKSGLTVTATCTDCHTAHHVLPRADSASSVNPKHVPTTCGRCHHGIEDQFERSIHVTAGKLRNEELPVCDNCHSAHTISRADQDGFKLDIMQKCGRCHEDIARTYFDTYHGKVSQLGYTKTAKCYDCHGAHDILPVSDPRSHLSRENVVATCQKCHPGATRRFAGYLTHATHHDPEKYPFLYWTFWGMTVLLVGTFAVSGLHTLLWLPRALQMRRDRRRTAEASAQPGNEEKGKGRR